MPDTNKNVTTCGCYLIYLDNILLCHATGNKSNTAWGIPKGLCEKNETPEDAMFREVYEETNIVIADYSHKCIDIGCIKYNKRPKTLHGFVIKLLNWDYPDIFCSSTYTDNQGVIHPEIDGFVWMPVESGIKYCNYTQIELWNRNFTNIKRLL